MKTKTKVIIGVSVLATAFGVALATPIVNLTSPILGKGNHSGYISAKGVAEMSNGEYFGVQLTTEGPSSIITQEAAYQPGGENGWHSHPGLVAVTLTAGAIQWYNANCDETDYVAGDSWVEGSQVHFFRVVGTTNVQLLATYIIALGEAPRTDQPAPACAAKLGLK